jgi:hypothetical protein
MNSSSKPAHHLIYWLLGALIVLAFGLIDAVAVALPAMALSVSQLFAGAMAFALIAGGLLYTVWRLEG